MSAEYTIWFITGVSCGLGISMSAWIAFRNGKRSSGKEASIHRSVIWSD